MPDQVTNYQCPACTGPLHFSASSGKLECEYCGSSFSVAEVEELYGAKEDKAEAAYAASEQKRKDKKEKEQNSEEAEYFTVDEASGLRTYSCPSCGAEIICDENTAATECVYCGNPTIIPGQFSNEKKPDYVIPFKLKKEDAVEKLKQYYKGKRFLPKAFSNTNHIDEIKGIYVPFWLYNGKSVGDCQFECTNSRSYTTGDYEVTETDHFQVVRKGSMSFERVPADGSSSMPDEHMDAISPYDYGELVKFSTAYLPGYLADKYDVDAESLKEGIEERIDATTKSVLRNSVISYATVQELSSDVKVRFGKTEYALLPVWLLHTKWNNTNYLFAMNGQTGKLVGDLPISKGKVAAWFAGIAAPLMIILALLLLGF